MQHLFLPILALTHLSVSTGNPIHFDSYHFEWNDQTQWSFNTDLSDFNSLTDERIACTVDVPSLCAMTIPSNSVRFGLKSLILFRIIATNQLHQIWNPAQEQQALQIRA